MCFNTLAPYSRGSIVVDSVLQFDASNGTSPNLTEVKNTLIEAAGNLSFQIDTTSINVTDISSSGQCIFKDVFPTC